MYHSRQEITLKRLDGDLVSPVCLQLINSFHLCVCYTVYRNRPIDSH